jgi:hypothetical protein
VKVEVLEGQVEWEVLDPRGLLETQALQEHLEKMENSVSLELKDSLESWETKEKRGCEERRVPQGIRAQ